MRPLVKNLSTKEIGQLAENQACLFLKRKGLILVERNYYCRYGEIDLIMQDQDDIVFVEVRSRSQISQYFGSALESINPNKIKKLLKTALHYLQMKGILYKKNSRFDVIAMDSKQGQNKIEWIKNAFAEVNFL